MTTTNTNTHSCTGKKNKRRRNSHCRDRVHYAVSDTTPESTPKGWNASYVCRWSIAAGKRPVPFRTRKLSLHTLMVLQPGGCGRVSHRRHQTTTNNKIMKQEGKETANPPSPSLFTFCRNRRHTTELRHTRPVALDPMELHTCRGSGRQRTLNLCFYPRFLVGCDSGDPCGFRASYSNINTPTKATTSALGIL